MMPSLRSVAFRVPLSAVRNGAKADRGLRIAGSCSTGGRA
jgi:hypothetical protein